MPLRLAGRTSTIQLAGLAGVVVSLAFLGAPASVGAAQPKPGGQYGGCKGSSCELVFDVTRDGRYVRGFEAFNRCAYPPPVINGMRISRAGDFDFSGRRGSLRVTIHGRFTSRSRAVGTVRYRRRGCDSRAVHWAAALVRR
jgi:hypothetical protein